LLQLANRNHVFTGRPVFLEWRALSGMKVFPERKVFLVFPDTLFEGFHVERNSRVGEIGFRV
jgi:hypothetical protein